MLLALLFGLHPGGFFGAEHISICAVGSWRGGGSSGIKCSNARQFFIEVARDGDLNSLRALPDQRQHGVESQAQGAGFIDLSEDMLAGPSRLERAMEQLTKRLAIYLKMPGSLVDADLKDLFDLFVGEVGCLDEEIGQRRIACDGAYSCRLAARSWQGTDELRRRYGVAADEHDGGGLGAFAQDIDQSVEQIAANCDQFGVGIVELGVALEGEEKLSLIGEDTLGLGGQRGLVNLTAYLFRRCANGTQPIQDKAAQL